MISVKSLSKHYGPLRAVDGISFEVKKGDILGFLGPNGAGKSTTMKMITTFVAPTSGDVQVDGLSVMTQQEEVRRKTGYMPENAPLYEDLTVNEFLAFTAKMREVSPDRVGKVIEMCALQGMENRLIENLSKGYKRRVSLAQALVHDPQILVLDEPTDGLDPNQKHDVRMLIKSLSKDKSIIFSTHILEEVEAICNRAIIISKGKIDYDGTPENLKSKSNRGKLDDVFRALTTKDSVEGVRL